MTEEEKAAQRALGTEQVFVVTVVIPVVGAVTVRKEVMATSEEDAIERIKQIEMMTPPKRLEQELFPYDTAPGGYTPRNVVKADKSKPREYTARVVPQYDDPNSLTAGTGSC